MLKTIEWSGIPVITGSLTDFLLCIEDYLDDNAPLFIRLGGVWDLLPRLTATTQKKEEDGLVLSDGLTAGCLSLKTHTQVFSASPESIIDVILNLASDTNKHVLLITDHETKYTSDTRLTAYQRNGRLTVVSDRGVGECELLHWIVKRGTAFFICDSPDTRSYPLFESVVAASSKAIIWIQMPTQHRTSHHPAIRPKEKKQTRSNLLSYVKAKAQVFLCVLKTELRLS
jgi:hypothetical protein